MRTPFVLLVAAALAMPGCASIPWSTAITLSALQPSALAQVDSGDVRVRISIPTGFQLDVPASRLTLSLRAPDGRTQHHELSLTLLGTSSGTRSTGLFSADRAVSTYTLALDPAGVGSLRAAQQFLLAESPDAFEFGVSVPLATMPAGTREILFWADLRLSSSEPWMPLIDGARIGFEASESGN